MFKVVMARLSFANLEGIEGDRLIGCLKVNVEGNFKDESSAASITRSKCTWLSALKGGAPKTISYAMAPTDHKSALASYFSYLNISGA